MATKLVLWVKDHRSSTMRASQSRKIGNRVAFENQEKYDWEENVMHIKVFALLVALIIFDLLSSPIWF